MKFVKLTLASATLASTFACAASEMYIGAEYGNSVVDRTYALKQNQVTISDSTMSDTTTTGSVKIGFGKFEDNRLEFGIQNSASVSAKGENTTLYNSASTNSLTVDYLVTMPSVSTTLMPFIKMGASLSQADLGFTVVQSNGEARDKIYGAGLTGGVGAMYKINDHLEALVGFDYAYRSWEDIQSSNSTYVYSTSDVIKKYYAGFNVRF